MGKLNVSELSPWQQSPAGSQHSETKAGQVCTEQGGSLLQAVSPNLPLLLGKGLVR